MLINITIPVYNEEKALAQSVLRLDKFLSQHCRFPYEVIIANNASTDKTAAIADELTANHEHVRSFHFPRKGRGGALRAAWMDSRADIVSYMDVDLSTDLYAFPPLIESILAGGFDLATGSRLLKPHLTRRGIRREVISRCYNRLIKLFVGTRFSDAQCGFKAVRRNVLEHVIPLVQDNGWFFDTELLVLSEKLGYQIFDLPVRWVDDPESSVHIMSCAYEDIKGLIRVRRNLWRGKYQSAGPRVSISSSSPPNISSPNPDHAPANSIDGPLTGIAVSVKSRTGSSLSSTNDSPERGSTQPLRQPFQSPQQPQPSVDRP